MKKIIIFAVLKKVLMLAIWLVFMQGADAHANDGRDVGYVSTVFKLLTPNDKIKVAAFEDPQVKGITCFLSRAVTGGLKGAIGVAEDTSDAAIACRQTGPISFVKPVNGGEKGEEIFDERRSFLFKQLHVTRFYDEGSNSLVYLSWSDRVIEGSPKNSVSAVPLAPWNGEAAPVVSLKK